LGCWSTKELDLLVLDGLHDLGAEVERADLRAGARGVLGLDDGAADTGVEGYDVGD
jgi:hypothetical protein